MPSPVPRHTQQPPIIRTEFDTRNRKRMSFENRSDRFPSLCLVQSNDGVFRRGRFTGGDDDWRSVGSGEGDDFVSVSVDFLNLSIHFVSASNVRDWTRAHLWPERRS